MADVETFRRVMDRLTKDAPAWVYDESTRNYRDQSSGQFMDAATRIELRDEVTARRQARIADLTDRLNRGDLTPAAYESAMRTEIQRTQIQQYAFGRGGIHALTDDDKTAIAANIGTQRDYLAGFRADIESGSLSADQISARAALYGSAGTGAFERGKASAWSLRLPTYPGEQECKGNCRCRWDIVDGENGPEATWVLDGGTHCDDCMANASEYAPWKGA